jgi:predicted transcriptional regulator
MARPASRHPTELELEILKILWRHGPLNVREVRERLSEVRQLAYTSVMTVMNIMVKKGYLQRNKKGLTYVYQPRTSRQATVRRMLGDLTDRLFNGSAASLMLNLLETAEIDPDELEKLRELIVRKTEEQSP